MLRPQDMLLGSLIVSFIAECRLRVPFSILRPRHMSLLNSFTVYFTAFLFVLLVIWLASIATQPVVMDVGSGWTRMGLAGQERPSCVFPTVVGRVDLRAYDRISGQV